MPVISAVLLAKTICSEVPALWRRRPQLERWWLRDYTTDFAADRNGDSITEGCSDHGGVQRVDCAVDCHQHQSASRPPGARKPAAAGVDHVLSHDPQAPLARAPR